MKIALCQINPTLGDFENNKSKILNYYNRSLELNPDIVVFPEMSISGYPPQDLLWEDGFIDTNLACLMHIANSASIPIILGYIRKKDNKIFNSAGVCYNGKLQSTVDKILLPTYDVFDEDRYFTSGKNPRVVSIPILGEDRTIGIQICEDLWDHDYDCKVTQKQKEIGAEIIINISASPYHEGRLMKRRKVIQEKVNETGLPIFYCNMVGGQDELIFDGESLAFNQDADCIGQGKAFEEEILCVDLGVNKKIKIEICSREEKLYNALCLGVSDYFKKSGHTEALIGLSGGIDSALTAVIATDALGCNNVHGVSLPSKYSSDHSISDAQKLAENLGIDYRMIPIQGAVDELERLLQPHFLDTQPDVTEENIQARIRGNLLMSLSNKFGWMVLSTGNKTELALGYCTLYGDMSGGLSVISDLSKSDVYSLSKWVNSINPERIPINSINKEPSAELAPNQVDPFDYNIVSPLVDAIIEDRKSMAKLIKEGVNINVLNNVYKKIRLNEYKRRQSAPGLRVSSKAFGVGRRMPIINYFQGES